MGVARDEPAKDDATVKIHAVKYGLHDIPTHILEIDINPVRRGGGELPLPVGVPVVDGDIEAEIVFDPLTFFLGTGDANDTTAVNLANLPDDATGGAGCARDHKGLASLRLTDIEKTEIGGHAVDAESAEEVDVGEERDGGEFLEGIALLTGEEEVLLEAGEAEKFVTFLEVGMARFDDFGEAKGAHHLAELHRWHVLRYVSHPNAHCGVDGEIFDARESLAIGERRNSGLGELQDIRRHEFLRTS